MAPTHFVETAGYTFFARSRSGGLRRRTPAIVAETKVDIPKPAFPTRSCCSISGTQCADVQE
jgi:hypothetical protein